MPTGTYNRTKMKETVKIAQYKRWRKERGVKLVMTIMPFGKKKRTTCNFEGETYVGVGKTNLISLDNCFKALTKANLNN